MSSSTDTNQILDIRDNNQQSVIRQVQHQTLTQAGRELLPIQVLSSNTSTSEPEPFRYSMHPPSSHPAFLYPPSVHSAAGPEPPLLSPIRFASTSFPLHPSTSTPHTAAPACNLQRTRGRYYSREDQQSMASHNSSRFYIRVRSGFSPGELGGVGDRLCKSFCC
jgi:hypothetical protein